jgi:hypothetical protein
MFTMAASRKGGPHGRIVVGSKTRLKAIPEKNERMGLNTHYPTENNQSYCSRRTAVAWSVVIQRSVATAAAIAAATLEPAKWRL